jgi:hypothetical protein
VAATRYRLLARPAGGRGQFLGEGNDGQYYRLVVADGGVRATLMPPAAMRALRFSPAWFPLHERAWHSPAAIVPAVARL